MKYLFVFFLLSCGFFYLPSLAQDAQPSPAVVAATPAPVIQAVEPPPQWLVTGLETVYKIPYVGPIAAKVVQWLAVLGMIMTALVSFLLVSIKALSSVLSLAKLTEWAALVSGFQDSKIMYYMKWFSFLNAKKPDGSAQSNS